MKISTNNITRFTFNFYLIQIQKIKLQKNFITENLLKPENINVFIRILNLQSTAK